MNYVNLRETSIETLDEVKKLIRFNTMKYLNLLGTLTIHHIGTPVTDATGPGIKKELLIIFEVLKLKKINKEEVTVEDLKEVDEEKKERQRLEEEARLEAERLAKEKEEQERKEREEQEEKEREEREQREKEEQEQREKEQAKREAQEQAEKEAQEITE